jgi:hypothetical protein
MNAPNREPLFTPFEVVMFALVTAGLVLLGTLQHFGLV